MFRERRGACSSANSQGASPPNRLARHDIDNGVEMTKSMLMMMWIDDDIDDGDVDNDDDGVAECSC